jgi:hypothetical protein
LARRPAQGGQDACSFGGRDTSGRVAEPWGDRTPYGPGAPWPVRVDTFLDVERSRRQLDTLGPGSIGFYTSGQLFCEEYYTWP